MKRCEDCAHFKEWIEYGNVLGDCHNERAFDFIGSLEGIDGPNGLEAAAAGCPCFERRPDKRIVPARSTGPHNTIT